MPRNLSPQNTPRRNMVGVSYTSVGICLPYCRSQQNPWQNPRQPGTQAPMRGGGSCQVVGFLEEASLLSIWHQQAEASWEQAWEGLSGRGQKACPGAQAWGVPMSPFQTRSSRKEKTQRPYLVSGLVMALQAEGLGSWERALGGLVGLSKDPRGSFASGVSKDHRRV